MGWESLLHVGLNGLHEVESDDVELGGVLDASLVDGAGADVGSGSGKSDAKGPAGLGDLLSALTGALLQFGLTSRSLQALVILVRALLLQAFQQFLRLGEGDGK
jgi:hypothetical protein